MDLYFFRNAIMPQDRDIIVHRTINRTYPIVFESNTIVFYTKPFALDFNIVYDQIIAV